MAKHMFTTAGFTIATETEEQMFRDYVQYRDAVRDVLGHGVYPNLVKALATYAEFDRALAGELADADLLAYHETLMGPIAPYVAQLRELAAGIVEIMDAIEAASPGTFGIAPEPGPEMMEELL